MNLPNKLTLLRIILIPVMVIIFYIEPLKRIDLLEIPLNYFIAGIIFIIASFTDFLDGYLARKNNMVTTFGKFSDPLADKMLVVSALILLMDVDLISAWIIVVILAREFIVSGIRLIAVERGKVIAASNFGKYKTVVSMITIIFFFFLSQIVELEIIGIILTYGMLFLTILSGVDYFWKNRKIILESI